MTEKTLPETAEELRDIADVLSITAGTDANIKKSMEAIMRIAYRIDRRNEGSGEEKKQALSEQTGSIAEGQTAAGGRTAGESQAAVEKEVADNQQN